MTLNEFLRQQLENGATLLVEDPADLHGYTGIPNAVLCNPAFSATDVRIYGIIRSHLRPGQVIVWPGQDRIAAMAGVVRETVNRSLARLRKAGLIDWFRRGQAKTNVYILKQIPASIAEQYSEFTEAQGNQHSQPDKYRQRGEGKVSDAGNPCVSSDVTSGSHQKNAANPCGCSDVTLGSHLDVTLGSHKENKEEESCCCCNEQNQENLAKKIEGSIANRSNKEEVCSRAVRGDSKQQGDIPCVDDVARVALALVRVVPALDDANGITIAETLLKEFDADQILPKVELLREAGYVKNVGGWLRQAVRDDWQHIPKNPSSNKVTRRDRNRPRDVKERQRREKERRLLESLYL